MAANEKWNWISSVVTDLISTNTYARRVTKHHSYDYESKTFICCFRLHLSCSDNQKICDVIFCSPNCFFSIHIRLSILDSNWKQLEKITIFSSWFNCYHTYIWISDNLVNLDIGKSLKATELQNVDHSYNENLEKMLTTIHGISEFNFDLKYSVIMKSRS